MDNLNKYVVKRKTASKGKAAREALEEAMAKYLARGGRVKKLPKGRAQGTDLEGFQRVGRPKTTLRTKGGGTLTIPQAGVKIASYGKVNKYVKKKKLAHALMLKLANPVPNIGMRTPKVPPAVPTPPVRRKPLMTAADQKPGLRMVGRTRGKVIGGPYGAPVVAGGGDPIYKRVSRTKSRGTVPPASDMVAKLPPIK